MKKGFTLIELLIVIAIIGILASALLVSLGGARQSARDSRRLADVRQVQAALEVYFNACGHYPGVTTCGAVGNSNGAWNTGAAGQLDDTLTGAGIGISQIPYDPTGGGTGNVQDYLYQVNAGNNRQGYVVRARLETNNAALGASGGDLDGTVLTIDCSDTSTNYFYCVGI